MNKEQARKLSNGDILFKYVFNDEGEVFFQRMKVVAPVNKAGRIHIVEDRKAVLGHTRGGYFLKTDSIDEGIVDARRKMVVLSEENFQKAKAIVVSYLEDRRDIMARQFKSAQKRLENVKNSQLRKEAR